MERRIEGHFFQVEFKNKRFYMRGPSGQDSPPMELVSAVLLKVYGVTENQAMTELRVTLRVYWTIYQRLEELGLFGIDDASKSHPLTARDFDMRDPVDVEAVANADLVQACADLVFAKDDPVPIEALTQRMFNGDAPANGFKWTENYQFAAVSQTSNAGETKRFERVAPA